MRIEVRHAWMVLLSSTRAGAIGGMVMESFCCSSKPDFSTQDLRVLRAGLFREPIPARGSSRGCLTRLIPLSLQASVCSLIGSTQASPRRRPQPGPRLHFVRVGKSQRMSEPYRLCELRQIAIQDGDSPKARSARAATLRTGRAATRDRRTPADVRVRFAPISGTARFSSRWVRICRRMC